MTKTLISPNLLKKLLPLRAQSFLQSSRKQAQQILMGKDHRLLIVTGPCSIHAIESALEYAHRLKRLQERVKESCFLVMRVYGEKPRTTVGWKGLLYDPQLDGTHDIAKGLHHMRALLLALSEIGVPTATEFVDPLAAAYIDDLITWGFIGARTSESQPHRQLASSLEMPIGFKNATDGSLEGAVNGVLSAKHPHSFLYIDQEGKVASCRSAGNPHAHIVLRGSSDKPNYDSFSVYNAVSKLLKLQLTPRILIDCAHGNCRKDHEKQKEVFESVIKRLCSGDPHLMGVMLESHIEAGNQSLSSSPNTRVSVTDPCIDWELTESLISWADDSLLTGPSGRSSTLSG